MWAGMIAATPASIAARRSVPVTGLSLPGRLAGYQPLLNMMLAKEPDKRFANYEELIAALEAAKAGLEATLEKLNEQIKALEEDLANLNLGKEQLTSKLKNKEKLLRELLKKEAAAKKRLATFKKILSQFKSLIKSGKLNVKIRRGKMVLELPSAILFESGKADLSDDGKKTLQEVAGVLVKIRKREFQVSGHTDNVPIKSSRFPSNWELSTARATTVLHFLQEKANIPGERLSAVGFGEYHPISSNSTANGRAQNRRIQIEIKRRRTCLQHALREHRELRDPGHRQRSLVFARRGPRLGRDRATGVGPARVAHHPDRRRFVRAGARAVGRRQQCCGHGTGRCCGL